MKWLLATVALGLCVVAAPAVAQVSTGNPCGVAGAGSAGGGFFGASGQVSGAAAFESKPCRIRLESETLMTDYNLTKDIRYKQTADALICSIDDLQAVPNPLCGTTVATAAPVVAAFTAAPHVQAPKQQVATLTSQTTTCDPPPGVPASEWSCWSHGR